MRRIVLGVCGLLAAGAAPAADPTPPADGLTTADRADFYHLPEGSEVFPLDWARALTDARTGRPFLDDLGRFGLVPDPDGPPVADGDPRKLPVGLTKVTPRGSTVEMLGINCAACHTAELRVRGAAVRVDGGPALFDIERLYAGLFESAAETVKDEAELARFLGRMKANGPRDAPTRILVDLLPFLKQPPADRDPAGFEGLLLQTLRVLAGEPGADPLPPGGLLAAADPAGVEAAVRGAVLAPLRHAVDRAWRVDDLLRAAAARRLDPAAVPLLLARVSFLRKVRHLQTLAGGAPRPGPGRVDAFTNARNFLFDEAEARPPLSPVRYPTLWNLKDRAWLHWDGNTNSVLERNVGQALGVGAVADPASDRSTVRIGDVHRLEQLARQLAPPKWPDGFGAVARAGADFGAGRGLYAAHCAACHDRQEPGTAGRVLPTGGVVYDVGTDPMRLRTWAEPLRDGRELAAATAARVRVIKLRAYADDRPALVRDFGPGFEAAFDLPAGKIVWRTTNGYVARPLAGVWATAPYLHNGSVPTLADLLKPAADRPVFFPVGHREYDPAAVGFVADLNRIPAGQLARVFVFDTRPPGNRNTGHEYGTALPEKQKGQLLLYLKAKD